MWSKLLLLMVFLLSFCVDDQAAGGRGGDVSRLDSVPPERGVFPLSRGEGSGTPLLLAQAGEKGGVGAASGEKGGEGGEEKKYCWERYGFEIHGSVVGFGQGGMFGTIEGERIGSSSAGGITFDLEIGYTPPVPFLENGKFFIHAHAG